MIKLIENNRKKKLIIYAFHIKKQKEIALQNEEINLHNWPSQLENYFGQAQ